MYGGGYAMEPVWVGTLLVGEAQRREERGGPSRRARAAMRNESGGVAGSWGRRRPTAGSGCGGAAGSRGRQCPTAREEEAAAGSARDREKGEVKRQVSALHWARSEMSVDLTTACGAGAERRHDEEGRRRGAGTAASRLQVWRGLGWLGGSAAQHGWPGRRWAQGRVASGGSRRGHCLASGLQGGWARLWLGALGVGARRRRGSRAQERPAGYAGGSWRGCCSRAGAREAEGQGAAAGARGMAGGGWREERARRAGAA
jgi:hypothetical protein